MSSEIRISGGILKDKKIRVLKQGIYRITMEQVRKSIFDLLGEKIQSSIFLDLFAGSGIVGIEALSYGAEKVIFVENHFYAVKLLKENIKSLNIENKTRVIYKDVFIFLRKETREKYDIIFADPPYELDMKIKNIVKYVEDYDWLKEDGILIIEHHKKTEMPDKYNRLKKLYKKNFGETVLSFYSYGS